ncbi:MAG: AMP-binding protein [Actinomycetaceae bacterium]|nr:AMP-binding protein [Actinomycetaceae bacterium]
MNDSTFARHYADGVPTHITPPDKTIDRLLTDAAFRFPQRVALDFLGRSITYAELEHHCRKTAAALYRIGVRRGDVVALIMPNCPQHVVAFYAAASLGAIVAEHNPLAPEGELEEQLARHGARVVIGWEQTLERIVDDGDFKGRTYLSVDLSRELPHRSRFLLRLPLPSARAQRAKLRARVPAGVISFDDLVKKTPALEAAIASEHPEMDDIAVLIHTGGTTGTPKAVALTHLNLTSNVEQTAAWVPIIRHGEETMAGILPFFHAFGLQTVLSLGVRMAATLVLLPKFDVASFLAAQKRRPITLFPGVPPMFERILDAVEESEEPVSLASVGFAFSGAMSLSPALAARWEEATGGYVIEGYGMSEASPIIAGSPVSAARRPSTLGLPFPSTDIRLADPDDPETNAEGIGEILVRGPQVFSGYYGNPEETAQVLTPDGWLRTGDLAYWDDGFLIMADRCKELIINGGFNVYPSQVESAIRDMPGVRDVAVVGMPEDSRGESVVAALVLEPGTAVDLDAVRRWTQDKLSHYAMPRSIAIVDELPRSQLGKVMRRSVREQLADFELRAGQWRKKAGEIGEATGETFEAFVARLQRQFDASREQVGEFLASTGESMEDLRTWFSEKKPSAESVRQRLSASGISRDEFAAWLERVRSSEAVRQGTGAISGAMRSATDSVSDAARNVSEVAKNAGETVSDLARGATSAMADAASRASESVSDVARGTTGTVSAAARGATEALHERISGTREDDARDPDAAGGGVDATAVDLDSSGDGEADRSPTTD